MRIIQTLRVRQPNLHSWSKQDEPLRLQELACYGMPSTTSGHMHLGFVSDRPVGQVTTDFLKWLCEQVQAQGKRVFVLIWDNTSWHVSKQIKVWLREHNQIVRNEGSFFFL